MTDERKKEIIDSSLTDEHKYYKLIKVSDVK